jgi:hypothetical protein
MPDERSRIGGVVCGVAATGSCVAFSLLSCACLARFLPLSPDARFAVGFVSLIPILLVTTCFSFIAKQAVLFTMLIGSLVLAALLYTTPTVLGSRGAGPARPPSTVFSTHA